MINTFATSTMVSTGYFSESITTCKPGWRQARLYLTRLCLMMLAALAVGCATLPDNSQRSESHFLADTDDTTLGQQAARHLSSHPGQTGALPLGSGLDAFVARSLAASMAEKTLDVQYYLYHRDKVGALLTHQLLAAADRGVRVRILLDDMDLADRDFSTAIVDAHPNIEIRIFNPFSRNTFRATQFVTRLGGVTRRMHNKSFTIDNQLSIVGGRNIGDEYFDASKEYTFSDLDVLLMGPAVEKVSHSFDLYWNSSLAYPLATLVKHPPTEAEVAHAREKFEKRIAENAGSEYLQALRESGLAHKIKDGELSYYWGQVDIVYDQPEKVAKSREKTEYHLSHELAGYFNNINNELLLISPYFVPGKAGVAFLSEMVARGVQVTVVTNSLAANDVPAVHAGYMKYRKALLRAGVTIYEFKSHSNTDEGEQQAYGDLYSGLHAKSFIFDRKAVFIGSMNLDPRSARENTEIGAVIHSEKLAREFQDLLTANFDRITYKVTLEDNKLHWYGEEKQQPVEYTHEPDTSWWQRFSIGLMRLIPAESQL